MPQVHKVEKARKPQTMSNGEVVPAGGSYYWWKFRYGGKRKSTQYPKRSELTQSAFLGALYELEDRLGDLTVTTFDDLQGEIEVLVDEIRTLGEEAQESLENMPEHLQDTSDAGQLLRERVDGLEEWATELENVDTEPPAPEDLEEEAKGNLGDEYTPEDLEEEVDRLYTEKLDEVLGEVQNIGHSL